MLASEIINNQCCGNLLDDQKSDLVKKVEILEVTILLQENQLENAVAEIKRLTKLVGGNCENQSNKNG